MKNKFSDDASRVTAYDEALQAMCRAKINANGMGLYWGTPQVINFKERVTGESKTLLYPYPSGHKLNGHRQYNTLATCRVEVARQRNAVRGQAQVEVIARRVTMTTSVRLPFLHPNRPSIATGMHAASALFLPTKTDTQA